MVAKLQSSPLLPLLLVMLRVASTQEAERSDLVLGHMRRSPGGAISELSRNELKVALADYGISVLAVDTDDHLKLRLYHVRRKLVAERNARVMQAETIIQEVNEQSGVAFVTQVSVDDVLAEDNAIYTTAARNRVLAECQNNAVIGAILAIFLMAYTPFGRLHRGAAVLPPSLSFAPSPSSAAVWRSYLPITLAGSALLGLLQLAKQAARDVLDAPSYFCEKLAAVVCRDGIFEWMLDEEDEQQRRRQHSGPQPRRPDGDDSDDGDDGDDGDDVALVPALFEKAAVSMPVLLLAAGSSLFEEATFRGVLLHGLIKLGRLRPWLAALLSSLVFGVAHVGNEADPVQKAIYAGWTFAGGLVFSGAYLATRGGCLVPTLLHFGLNAIIFGDSARKVARHVWEERKALQAIATRVSNADRAAAAARPSSDQPAADASLRTSTEAAGEDVDATTPGDGGGRGESIGSFQRMKTHRVVTQQ